MIKARDQQGQATTEYILLLAVVLSFYLMVAKFLNQIGFTQKLTSPITRNFVYAYQYGKIPKMKSQAGDSLRPIDNNNFRVFLNPSSAH